MTTTMSTLPCIGSPLGVFPITNMERMYAAHEAWNARHRALMGLT
jgi:hypothetical protein